MLLEIIHTTDDQNIWRIIDTAAPIVLENGATFVPDRTVQTAPTAWRLFNSNYVIDAKEV
jgi:hypothetical protein